MEIVIDILILVAGFALLVKGADFFVDGSVGVAERFKIPHLVIGLTIVAMGTSAPEAAVSISSALKGNSDITIGNVIGSNIFNVFIILGFTAMIAPLAIKYVEMKKQIIFLAIVSILLIVLGLNQSIGLLEGSILVLLLVGYVIVLIKEAKQAQDTGEPDVIEEKNIKRSLPLDIVLVVVGLAAIIWGSDLAVDSATDLAVVLGVSQRVIGLTIIAMGTSLPELATSLVAAMKGNSDIAIGNIVGSNIFNILFVVGASAMITVVPFNQEFIFDALVALAAGIVLFPFARKGVLGRIPGTLFVLAYAGYFLTLM